MKISNKILAKFKDWLLKHGAVVRPVTNRYELVRFVARGETCIIYMNKNKMVSAFTGFAREAYDAFSARKDWDGGNKTPRSRSTKARNDAVCAILERDGTTCAYCGHELTEDTATIEHFVPLCQGGPNTLANMVLACQGCNQAAANKHIRQKMEMLVKIRIENVF